MYSLPTVISRDRCRISVSLDSRSIRTMDEGSVADPPMRKTFPFFAARLPQMIWLIGVPMGLRVFFVGLRLAICQSPSFEEAQIILLEESKTKVWDPNCHWGGPNSA